MSKNATVIFPDIVFWIWQILDIVWGMKPGWVFDQLWSVCYNFSDETRVVAIAIRRHALGSVLVLNASFEPLSVVSIQRAIVLLLKEKAELVEAAEAFLRSERLRMPVPLVIRLVYYVRIPYRISIPVTRRAVLVRDRYTCQYCGAQPGRQILTIDHVLPRSKGGKTTWQNVVAACKRCNGKKGNRTPAEASMKLANHPTQPRYLAMVYVTSMEARDAWEKYMN